MLTRMHEHEKYFREDPQAELTMAILKVNLPSSIPNIMTLYNYGHVLYMSFIFEK